MNITKSDRRDLAAEHYRYLERITPLIRNRLASRGANEAKIAAHIAEIPAVHFLKQLKRAAAAMQLKKH